MPLKRLDHPPEPRGEAPAASVLALSGPICDLSPGAGWTRTARPPLPRTPGRDSAGATGPLKAGCGRAAACAWAGGAAGASPGSPGLGPSPGVPRAELPHLQEPPAALPVAWLSHFSPGAGGAGGSAPSLCKAARGFPEPGAALSPSPGTGPPQGREPAWVRRGLQAREGAGGRGGGPRLQVSRRRGQGAGLPAALCPPRSPGLTGVGPAGPDPGRARPSGQRGGVRKAGGAAPSLRGWGEGSLRHRGAPRCTSWGAGGGVRGARGGPKVGRVHSGAGALDPDQSFWEKTAT